MERKIGEIFKYNGEWYQCLEDNGCLGCTFLDSGCDEIKSVRGKCARREREDRRSVIFKKLEKVGKPIVIKGKRVQLLKSLTLGNNCSYCCFLDKNKCLVSKEKHLSNTFYVEIKQNKEDMEEKKQKLDDLVGLYLSGKITYKEFNKELKALHTKQGEEDKPILKPFNLEAAKAGKPVCTRDGRKARIIAFDRKGGLPIVALVESDGKEEAFYYLDCGKDNEDIEKDYDLMMLPEKKEGWVNLYKSSAHSTKEEAMKYCNKCNDYIDTIKIEWEE